MVEFDVEDYVAKGRNAVVRKVVQKADCAGNYSSLLNEVMSTLACIDMAIRASVEAVDKHLPEGYVTVGREFFFTHDAPSSIDMTVNVRAKLVGITGRVLRFEITAWDEMGDVGHGHYERIVVKHDEVLRKSRDRAKFLQQRTF